MKLKNDPALFRESYYEHACSIDAEKDVTCTDIRGEGLRVALRRWWADKFLLSYSDVRCRFYYTSSHDMRMERMRQYRRHRNRIHPLSKFHVYWTIFIVAVGILNRFIFHKNTAVIYRRLTPDTHILGIILECIQIIDLFICFKTGYVVKENRTIILDTKKCVMKYCSTKLFIHVAAVLPLQTIMLIRFGLRRCFLCRSNKFTCVLKILSVFGLFRLFETAWIWNREGETFKKSVILRLFRLLTFAMVTVIQFMNLSDMINIWVIIDYQKIHPSSFIKTTLDVWNKVDEHDWELHVLALQFSIICKSIFMFNYSHFSNIFYTDAISSTFGYFITNIFLTWAFMEWYFIVCRNKAAEDYMVNRTEMAMNMLRTERVSDTVSRKVMRYFNNDMTKYKLAAKQNELLHTLPNIIIKEMTLSSHYLTVRRIPYFSDWPVEVVEDLTVLMREEIYSESDTVVEKWTPAEGLMVLRVGTLAVYASNNKEMGHLIDGDFFGEVSLITDREVRSSSVIAISNCMILVLNKKTFRAYMRNHPDLYFELKKILIKKFASKYDDDKYDDHRRSQEGIQGQGRREGSVNVFN